MRNDRRGFTIAELLVVAVLGSLLLMAIYQILLTNQRTYRANAEQVRGQQTARIILDVLAAEIREISSSGGDITVVGASGIQFDVGRLFGVVCDVNYSPQYHLRVVKYEDWFDAGDNVVVFADNNPDIGDDDTWVEANVTQVDTASITCGGRDAQELRFTGQDAKFLSDSVRTGAPIRSLSTLRFLEAADATGTRWVYRNGEVFLGPIANGGLQFAYYDEDGNTTSTLSAVHSIEITVTAEDGTSLSTTVYPRN